LLYFTTIWNILRTFGILYFWYSLWSFGIFFRLGMFGPRKIWQPCSRPIQADFLPKSVFFNLARDRWYDFWTTFAENFWENIGVFCSSYSKSLKILIVTLVFEKNAIFFAENCAKVAKHCDHNIDPWSQSYDFGIYNYSISVAVG
jgi:hypothetical protein